MLNMLVPGHGIHTPCTVPHRVLHKTNPEVVDVVVDAVVVDSGVVDDDVVVGSGVVEVVVDDVVVGSGVVDVVVDDVVVGSGVVDIVVDVVEELVAVFVNYNITFKW